MGMHCERDSDASVQKPENPKILRLVILMALISQANGLTTEDEPGWHFELAVLVYTLAVIAVTWCVAWRYFRTSSVLERLSSLPVASGGSDTDVETVEYYEVDRQQMGARSSQEAAEVASGTDEMDLRGGHSTGNANRKIFLAPYGERFHRQRKCNGLASARKVFLAELCTNCLEGTQAYEKLYRAEKGSSKVVHGSAACAGRRCLQLLPCGFCG